MLSVVSFDVFETVLVRRIGEPAAAFALLGRDLRRRGVVTSAERFALARMEAERRARRRVGSDRDPTLVAIYRELAWALRWDDGRRDDTMVDELDLEAELLRPNPIALARLDTARRRGLRIVFTSDAYLPSAFIERQLRRHGCWCEGDGLLVSCEHEGTKRGGALFAQLIAFTGRRPEEHVHVGNDRLADDRAARRAGLQVSSMLEGNLTEDEQHLETHRLASGNLATVLAGSARLSRLQGGDLDPALRDASADVAAPALIAYTLWVLREAQRQELHRVYFLSREGQALFEVAQTLVEQLGLDIDIRYLYVSRQSINMAAIARGTRTELAWTLTHAETNTVRTLLGRLRLTPEEVRWELAALGIDPAGWDRVPDAALRAQLFAAMIDGSLRELVMTRAAEVRSTALAYLEQEGFLTSSRCGVVDVSGVGSQFKALSTLRAAAGRDPAQGFMFLRSRDPYLESEGGYEDGELPPTAVYLDDAVDGVGHGVTPGLVAMLEMFCAADHGTVLDYRRTSSGIEPVLAGEQAEHLLAWGLRTMREVVKRVAEQLWLDDRFVDLDGDLRVGVREQLERFWTRPSPEEARAWGSHPFDGTSGGEEPTPLASGLSAADVIAAVRSRGVVPEHWFGWAAASRQLSPALVRWSLDAGRSVKHLGGRLLSR